MFRVSSCPSSGAYKLVGPVVNRTDHDQRHCYHHVSNGKPEAATAVYKLLMMGNRIPGTCWAVFERRARNLRDWCIWLVDLLELTTEPTTTNDTVTTTFPTVNQRRLLQFISSWWWARGCPKHVEMYLNDEQYIWEIDASGWLIYLSDSYFFVFDIISLL